jgi:hypothetical protein
VQDCPLLIWRGILKDTSGGYEKTKEFRLPAIVPIILYNGYNNWTACGSFKEYLSGYELFGENIVDFKYILIDVNRYTKEELLETSNLISTVFLLEQEQDNLKNTLEILEKALNTLQDLEPKQTELLINWFVKILMGRIGREHIGEIKKIIQESREVDIMVSNIELLIENKMRRNRAEIEKIVSCKGTEFYQNNIEVHRIKSFKYKIIKIVRIYYIINHC